MAESKDVGSENISRPSCPGLSAASFDGPEEKDRIECAVCLQGCVHPVQLPCGHIFCFLCVKGVANQSKRCAMCRKELPPGYLEQPNLVGGSLVLECSTAFDDGQQWFYEGHNGWWQYDERTSAELETAFKQGDVTCELLIAGFLYVIDFQNMVQFRRNDPSRRRRIKRDLITIPKKGIAGLRVCEPASSATAAAAATVLPLMYDVDRDAIEGSERDDVSVLASVPSGSGAQALQLPPPSIRPKSPSPVPVAPNNTPQTPHTPSQDSGTSSPTIPCDSSLHRIVQDMENLLLGSIDLEENDDDDEDSLTEGDSTSTDSHGHYHSTFYDDLQSA